MSVRETSPAAQAVDVTEERPMPLSIRTGWPWEQSERSPRTNTPSQRWLRDKTPRNCYQCQVLARRHLLSEYRY
jgi:hypothetical protein